MRTRREHEGVNPLKEGPHAVQKIKTELKDASADPIDAIMAQLRDHDAAEEPINLFEIGPTLIGAGYTQEQLVNGLLYLKSTKQIELLPGNRVSLIMLL